ncbi:MULTISPECIES: hypothetical protein [unclassified Lentimonas]|uniref:HAD family hydrolase n=1 Tax=unclassified Lentimonas TaxID=2630993 RepID=UPI00132B33A4|nr:MULTISPECIES: hypothetical protein [unclassified Lentimonas]CAA6678614.1 Unannotated [Lentimonas sp. CC4]CAA6685846.1 Unannotated [Lentimonas sp. CC6]CAA7076320.1 Unannotated [Lentimonas sp. CC4]CAA7171867.1 Unannotated [Lentimonas sp. CC21]CAA7181574.1 Unannotated [Lentimonas sp. CC8]
MEESPRIYSFDIFDTLLSRDVADPQFIWVLLSNRLLDTEFSDLPIDLKVDFKSIRQQAEKRCTENTEGHEVTLDGIYTEIGRAYPELQPTQLEQVKQIEIELELKHIYGISENIATVLEHLSRGERVILASDMYLPIDTIRNLLRKADPKLAELKIYLSSERKAGKTNGALFDIICNEEKVRPSQIHHCGDNQVSDVSVPKALGAQVSHYSESKLTDYEACYSDKYFGLLPNVTAGICKRLRLSQRNPSQAYELGGGFTAPFFYGFVHDLVHDTTEDGAEAYYFLARDGYILLKMAQLICKQLGLKKELKYLYVSRESVYLASVHRINSVNLSQILAATDGAATVQTISDSLKIEAQVLQEILPENIDRKKHLTQTEINELKQKIIESQTACDTINRSASKAREELTAYLRSEGAFTHKKFALVDTGWRASIQDAIFSVMLHEKPDVEIVGYYYGSSEISEQTVRQNAKHAYMIKPQNKQKILKVIELLTMSDHGRTLGYEQSQQGSYTPILEAASVTVNEKEAYFKGIEDFTRRMTNFLVEYPNIQADFMAVDNCLLQELIKGNKFVAKHLGDLAFASGAFDNAKSPMAPEFSLLEALQYIFSSSSQRNQMTQWIEGTRVRSSIAPKIVLALDFRIILKGITNQVTTREQIWLLLGRVRSKYRSN